MENGDALKNSEDQLKSIPDAQDSNIALESLSLNIPVYLHGKIEKRVSLICTAAKYMRKKYYLGKPNAGT